MFTGIIEALGTVEETVNSGSNRSFLIRSELSDGFRPDQSVSHNGVCLTVESISNGAHRVTAIDETLQKTSLRNWQPGQVVNLERCLQVGSRLDGHFVQGHVDTTGTVKSILQKDGSMEIQVGFPVSFSALMIEKGSISVDGISLTAYNVTTDSFTVAIIPYTFDHTNLRQLSEGSLVNLEFDMIGKYINRIAHTQASAEKR